MTTIKALLFDFDGLILETEMPAFQAWEEIFREYGVELSRERWRDYIGREGGWFDVYAHLEELTGKPADRGALKARRTARRDELLAPQELQRGVTELFTQARARGLKVGVASSSTREWVCGHLDRLAFLSDWDAIVCRAEVAKAKPAPDLYLRATELLGVAPNEAVALEDSPNGIASAKAAGLWCVAVPNPLTRDLDLSRADLRLDSLADVTLDLLLAVLSRT